MSAASAAVRPDRATLLAFAGMVLFGGLNTIAVKVTVVELDPLWSAGARFILAGLVFAALTLGRRRSFPRGRSLVGATLYGLVGFAGGFGFIYPAMREVPAGTAAVVVALAPLATYGLAVAQRQERFRAQALVGALIALVGTAIVFTDQLGAAVPWGALLLVAVGMICLAESGIIAKWMPRSDPFGTNAVAMLAGGAALLVASFVGGEAQVVPSRAETWLGFGYITIFGSVVMFGLYLFGLARWTASGMSYATLMLPFVSVAAATVLTGEQFSIAFAAGGLVMVAGVYLGAFGRWRRKPSTATSLPECLPIADCPDATPRLPLTPAPTRG